MVFLKEAQPRLKKMRKTHSGADFLRPNLSPPTEKGSRLGRNKILLDKDFTVKITGYDFPVLVHGFFTHTSDFHTVPTNLSGFVELFREVLTGEQFHGFMSNSGKKALQNTAKLCFKICNEVDAESKMLTAIEKYEKHFQEWGIHNTNSEAFFRGINHNNLRKGVEKKEGCIPCMVFMAIFVGVILICLCVIFLKMLWLLIWAVMSWKVICVILCIRFMGFLVGVILICISVIILKRLSRLH